MHSSWYEARVGTEAVWTTIRDDLVDPSMLTSGAAMPSVASSPSRRLSTSPLAAEFDYNDPGPSTYQYPEPPTSYHAILAPSPYPPASYARFLPPAPAPGRRSIFPSRSRSRSPVAPRRSSRAVRPPVVGPRNTRGHQVPAPVPPPVPAALSPEEYRLPHQRLSVDEADNPFLNHPPPPPPNDQGAAPPTTGGSSNQFRCANCGVSTFSQRYTVKDRHFFRCVQDLGDQDGAINWDTDPSCWEEGASGPCGQAIWNLEEGLAYYERNKDKVRKQQHINST